MWQREYVKNSDYEFAFNVQDEPDVKFFECKHCGCYMTDETRMIEHLDEEHWWLKDGELIVVP